MAMCWKPSGWTRPPRAAGADRLPRFAAPDGTPLWFTDAGEGLPLLCLPGLTRNGGDFDHVAMLLPGTRIIRLDARGRGRSGVADPATYTVAQEARDALALMDHLGIHRAAVLGTSRGGLQGMVMAATARPRILGLALNDIGPVIERQGLEVIRSYLGRNPAQKTWTEAAEARARLWTGFQGVPHARWLHEVKNHYASDKGRLVIRYDPRLRDAVLADWDKPPVDLWPLFDACAGLPLCLIRGANSDLLSRATMAEMARRRPEMVLAEVPGRGHVPFLDEPGALDALHRWLGLLA
jgi:pimeloyl-ACP methyl ester carboxylesterase